MVEPEAKQTRKDHPRSAQQGGEPGDNETSPEVIEFAVRLAALYSADEVTAITNLLISARAAVATAPPD